MIAFLLYTLLALVANACFAKILFISIQHGQWLDSLLHWQQKLQRWDMDGKTFLAKAGGYCELCFSHAITFICFWGYVLFMQQAVGIWVSDMAITIWVTVGLNILWYIAYVSLGTNLSLWTITKMYNHEP